MGIFSLLTESGGVHKDALSLFAVVMPQNVVLLHAGENDVMILTAEEAGADRLRLRFHDKPLYLRVEAEGLKADAPRSEASVFSTSRWEAGREQVEVFTHLPRDFTFGPEGLTALLSSGEAKLRPVAAALLPALGATVVRDAWFAADADTRAVFHDLVRDFIRDNLGRFGSYTTDLMREDIAKYGWSIGEKTYGKPLIFEAGRGHLVIGRYCSMADPAIMLGNHNIATVTSYPFLDLWQEWPSTHVAMLGNTARDVCIGNDVWIGYQAVILPGAVIGDGAVIGAGCVVRGNVPPYAVCTGNPCEIKRYRFAPAVIERLLRLRWWDWPERIVDRYLPLMLASDIEAFLDKAEMEFMEK